MWHFPPKGLSKSPRNAAVSQIRAAVTFHPGFTTSAELRSTWVKRSVLCNRSPPPSDADMLGTTGSDPGHCDKGIKNNADTKKTPNALIEDGGA